MKYILLSLLILAVLTGCTTGQATDYSYLVGTTCYDQHKEIIDEMRFNPLASTQNAQYEQMLAQDPVCADFIASNSEEETFNVDFVEDKQDGNQYSPGIGGGSTNTYSWNDPCKGIIAGTSCPKDPPYCFIGGMAGICKFATASFSLSCSMATTRAELDNANNKIKSGLSSTQAAALQGAIDTYNAEHAFDDPNKPATCGAGSSANVCYCDTTVSAAAISGASRSATPGTNPTYTCPSPAQVGEGWKKSSYAQRLSQGGEFARATGWDLTQLNDKNKDQFFKAVQDFFIKNKFWNDVACKAGTDPVSPQDKCHLDHCGAVPGCGARPSPKSSSGPDCQVRVPSQPAPKLKSGAISVTLDIYKKWNPDPITCSCYKLTPN